MDLENIILNEISQTGNVKNPMWDINLKATNEQARKIQKLIKRANSMVVTRGRECGRVIKDKGGQIYGDRRWFDFGW